MTGTRFSEEHSSRPAPPRDPSSPADQLTRLFGSYKAEWLSEQLFDLFTEPDYWPELTAPRPCVLEGGRGTGKTTVLRSMSYEGQYALRGRGSAAFDDMDFIGFYTRVDTNRVRAFAGSELPEPSWVRIFAHYQNLSMVQQVLGFLDWVERHMGAEGLLSAATCVEVAETLNLAPTEDAGPLRSAVARSLRQLEADVNNIGDAMPSGLSLQKAPVDHLMTGLSANLPGKTFFFLFDEYENFTEYQQRVINTLVKHSGPVYSFKIGVRELGFRTKSTLNRDEQLVSPADYVRLNIGEKLSGDRFARFARRVCNSRLARIGPPRERAQPDIEVLLPGLSEDAEAEALGIQDLLRATQERVAQAVDSATLERFTARPPLDRLLAIRWADAGQCGLSEAVTGVADDTPEWRQRSSNYRYALLFTLRRGRGNRGIQKYYAGWDTFVTLAAGNIRYVLELVEQSLLAHLQQGQALTEPVTPAVQTKCAQAVGRKNLTELEGVSVQGARLTRLVLGLGRVFEVLATDPVGHAPEINEFELANPGVAELPSDGSIVTVDQLLRAAVMHLALLRRPASKVSLEPSDTRDFDYRLHPIFSPFFVFSHRSKRKMILRDEDLLGFVEAPRRAIPAVLKRHNRQPDVELPDQLQLFQSYFLGEP